MPNLTLRQLWHFVTAAEAGSLSEAARVLHMAPSAISMSLAQLERTSGAQLCVKRKSHGLTLTSAGREVYEQALHMLEIADGLTLLGGDGAGQLRGSLTVGCYMPLAPAVIPHMLSAFSRVQPGVEVNFLEGYHDDLQQALVRGEIDIAFLYNIGLGVDVRAESLLSVRPYLLLASDHPLAESAEVELSQIAHEPFVFYSAPPLSTRVLDLLRDAGIEPKVRHRSRSYATVRALVGAGVGVSVLFQQPEFDIAYASLGVVAKPLNRQPRFGHPAVALVRSRRVKPNARVNAWRQVAMASFRGESVGAELRGV